MSKSILIFSDGTGQFGGLRPDQRLSNVYKMYRAVRPGPDSPIDPAGQVAFYDPGLGVGEVGGFTFRRLRNLLESAVGTGIDENVIDCYERVIGHWEPGDRILLFGFSRGAYTVRALANVMNLCGVPTRTPDGRSVPRHGPELRRLAREAVIDVYNHGQGHPRKEQPFFDQREELGRRFRARHGSAPPAGASDVQGNVQPDFIGVFDTVAALGNVLVDRLVWSAMGLLLLLDAVALVVGVSAWTGAGLVIATALVGYWYLRVLKGQFKLFQPDPADHLSLLDPRDWPAIWRNSHWAVWRKKNYDGYLDSDVGHARHAMAIDERRASFPRVIWGMPADAAAKAGEDPPWLHQVWFAGCHSDIGGSYPEDESRLSDLALDWMVEQVELCEPQVEIREELLHRFGDPLGVQHEERLLMEKPFRVRWPERPRAVEADFDLHPSVITRLGAVEVPHVDEMAPYRPEQLRDHPDAMAFFGSAPAFSGAGSVQVGDADHRDASASEAEEPDETGAGP